MGGKRRKFFVVFVLLFTVSISVGMQDCNITKGTKIMITKNEDVAGAVDIFNQYSKQYAIKVERMPIKVNSSLIFTSSSCFEDVFRRLAAEKNIKSLEFFDVQFLKSQLPMRRRLKDLKDPEIVTKEYLTYEEGNAYIDAMVKKISKVNRYIKAEIKTEATTFEKRKIVSIAITNRKKPENPLILIDAGIHAREWHARSMGLYLLAKLLEEAKDKNGLLEKANFVILPSLNPDGYVYSFEMRMWRKNRRPVGNGCIGVDGNRNYDVDWDSGDQEKYPCEEVYHGSKPFSDVEANVMKNLMFKLKEKCKMYISIHTYGNTIMFPWGYKQEEHPRAAELRRVGQAGVDAVKNETGSVFETHKSAIMYVAPGGSDDFAIETVGIPFAYTLELGAEDFFFAVPKDKLKSTLNEGWIAIKAMVLEVLKV